MPVAAQSKAFLAGGGEMGAMMRAHDWSTSPLGPPEGWPQSLRSAVGLMLANKHVMFVAWGPELAFLYNDAYRPVFGQKHPWALGRPFREVWSEVWDQVEPLVNAALGGEATWSENLPLVLERNGYPEECWFTFSYSPVRDEDGAIVGLFCAASETTDAVLAERRQAFRLQLEQRLRGLFDPKDVMAATVETLGCYLGVSRVGYGEMQADDETIVFETDYANGVEHLIGAFPINNFGPGNIVELRRGLTTTYPDLEADPRTADAGFPAIEARAAMAVPLVRDGTLRALLYLNHREVRDWPADEVKLVEDVAARTWSAVELARAEMALRQSEARLGFLDRLGAKTAPLADADAVLATTTRLLGENLSVSICAYADMDEDEDGFTIRGDWAAPGSTSIVGHYRLADFGTLAVEKLRAGLPLVVNDNLRELAPEEAATFQNIGIAATICMPLVKEGRLTALMAIHDRAPRVWTDAELSLLREVTARSWAHVERVAIVVALGDSEKRHRQIVEGADGFAIVTLDAHGIITVWNTGAEHLLGYSETEAVGRHGEMFFTPEDRAAGAPDHEMSVAHDRGRAVNERWHLRQDGSRFWGSGLMMRLDEDGGGYLKMFRDRTAEYEGEQALHASEAQLRQLNETLQGHVAARTTERDRMWDTTRELLLVAEFDGVFRAVNPGWTRTLGYTEAETLGHSFRDFVVKDEVESTAAAVALAASGVDIDGYENNYRHKDGSVRRIAWHTSADGGLIYAFGRDVTDERAREEERQALEEQLRQSQKMEAMGNLTGGVAHDFNNLLTPILGSLDMLQRKGIGNEREQRLIAGALQSADRAKTLVQRLLAFARRQPLQTTSVDLTPLVRGMADLVSSTTGPQIKVVVDASEGLPPAKADLNQLEMAILNLAVNARDAMPEGGTLRISVDAETVGRQHRAGLPPGRYLQLSVADTGIGMDEETLRRAIEPFFSTKGIGKGTGLGLSMVHGLASQLGGAVTIQSSPGIGTNVELWLPQGAEPLVETRPVAHTATVARSCGTALLVDDEDLVRLSTADMLIDLGYAVVEAASAEEALKLVDRGLQPDVLITDHLMPGMTGTELARMLQGSRPGTKVLIVSGYAEADGVAPDLPRLTKPFRSVDLAESLAALG